MKIGDIVEQQNGPCRVTSYEEPRLVTHQRQKMLCGFTSYEPVEGPPTKEQHAYCEDIRQREEHQRTKAAALRKRIITRLDQEISPSILPHWDGSDNKFITPLVDLIVDLIHEESEY